MGIEIVWVRESRNTFSFWAVDIIGNGGLITVGAKSTHEKWADFAWRGDEYGTRSAPFNTFTEAIDAVSPE